MNLFNQNDLKGIVKTSRTENTELPDRFTISALKSPSGTVYENVKPFEITNLSRSLSDL